MALRRGFGSYAGARDGLRCVPGAEVAPRSGTGGSHAERGNEKQAKEASVVCGPI
jgi:hypothetical protein